MLCHLFKYYITGEIGNFTILTLKTVEHSSERLIAILKYTPGTHGRTRSQIGLTIKTNKKPVPLLFVLPPSLLMRVVSKVTSSEL